jgi:serine/threonine protein kinase
MDKYIVEEKVGEGAYGEVFKARIKAEKHRIVAIKRMFSQDVEEGVDYTAIQELKYLNRLRDCSGVIDLVDSFF